MIKLIFLSVFCLFSALADESDHPLTLIKGNQVELVAKGHSFAGLVKDQWIMAAVTGAGHSLGTLHLNTEKGIESFEFKKQDGVFKGEIKTSTGQQMIEFVSLDTKTFTYTMLFNQKEYKVRVEAEDFKNNHFINPTYILELEEGQQVQVKLLKGEACYMYSLQLIMMIFGTYLI
jgi:hypothetical protein